MEGSSSTNFDDTPMQNDDTIVATTTNSASNTNPVYIQSSTLQNNQGYSIYRSPNLPPNHYLLIRNPLSGNITADNCLIVDVSQLQQQNVTLVPSITQPIVNPPTEEQDSKERVQNYIQTLDLPQSGQIGGLVPTDEESQSQGNGYFVHPQQPQIANDVQQLASTFNDVSGELQTWDNNDVIVSQNRAFAGQQTSESNSCVGVGSNLDSTQKQTQQSGTHQQQGSVEISIEEATAVVSATTSTIQSAISVNNVSSIVTGMTNSAVVNPPVSAAPTSISLNDLDYRNNQVWATSGCGGVPSYSNVTSPSACTSPSDDEQMDGTTDIISSDNDDISDINRSFIQSGNFEKSGGASSGHNSGNATPGGSLDYQNYQQANMANGLAGDLPTMVLKDMEQSHCSDSHAISSDSLSQRWDPFFEMTPFSDSVVGASNGHRRSQQVPKRPFDAMYSRHSLIQQFPSSQEGVSLQVVNQPESRHRPRYLTEGSRGSVKDRSGNGFPAVKLFGFNQCPLTVQVFIGTDAGRPKPHGFFQACRVTGRNVISCLERNVDGTQIMEVDLDPKNEMRADIDCIGILKLRNADVEAMVSTTRSKKKSQRARMVFRVAVPRPDGSSFTLQTMSETIQCSQPTGQPEIVRLTTDSSPACGGGITYILGKHFTRPTVTFSRKGPLSGNPSAVCSQSASAATIKGVSDEETWTEVADLLPDCVSQHYLGCKIPPYSDLGINRPVYCEVTVTNGDNKVSDPAVFVYNPTADGLREVSLQDILSFPNSALTSCPMITLPPAAHLAQPTLTSVTPVQPMTSSANCYGGSSQAKRSRTSQPESEGMDQSPGSGSGGPVASDSNGSLHAKIASAMTTLCSSAPVASGAAQLNYPIGSSSAQMTSAFPVSLGSNTNLSSVGYVHASGMPLSSRQVTPPIVQAVHIDSTRLQLVGGTIGSHPLFQIPKQMSLKSTPVQQSSYLTNVSYSNSVSTSSVFPGGVHVKPEVDTVSCGAKCSTSATCSAPIVMPRGLITHVPPAQSILPHAPNLSNNPNFKMQQNTFPLPVSITNSSSVNDLQCAGSSQSFAPQMNAQPAYTASPIQPLSLAPVPMEVSKATTSQVSQLQSSSMPPSDSPLSSVSITISGSAPESAATNVQQVSAAPSAASMVNPDINSILKGLLLLGANSANPSTYAEFAIQISAQIQKDLIKTESSAGVISNPASVSPAVPPATRSLDSTPPPPSQSQQGMNSNPSSVIQMNFNSPGVATSISSSSANQVIQNYTSVNNQQLQTTQSSLMFVPQLQASMAQTHTVSQLPQMSQVGEINVVSAQLSSHNFPLSQTAQLTVAAISKNPKLAPFAPQLISAMEAVEQQTLNVSNSDPSQKELLVQQLAKKLATLAEQQQQQQSHQSYASLVGQAQPSQTSSQLTLPPASSCSQQMGGSQYLDPVNQQQHLVSSPPTHGYQHQTQQQQSHSQSFVNVSMSPQQPPSLTRQTSFTSPLQHQMSHLSTSQSHNMPQVTSSAGQPVSLDLTHSSVQSNTQPPIYSVSMSANNAALYYHHLQASHSIAVAPNILNSSQMQSQPPVNQQQIMHSSIQQPPPVLHQSQQQQQSMSQNNNQQQLHGYPSTPNSQYQQIYMIQPSHVDQKDQMLSMATGSGLDQPPPSVNSQPPPSVASMGSGPPPSVGPPATYQTDCNSPYSSPAASGAQTGIQPQSSMSMSNVSDAPAAAAQKANLQTSQNSTGTGYVVYSSQASQSAGLYYPTQSQKPQTSEMHSSNMDLSDPNLYMPQQQHMTHQTSSSQQEPREIEEHMFKEPYPVDTGQSHDWPAQQLRSGVASSRYGSQASATSLHDMHHHSMMSQPVAQNSMTWESSNSVVGATGSQMSMNWESSSSSNASGSGNQMTPVHHPAPMKSSTTDPFLSSGGLDTGQVQKTSSMMDIHSFEHDQNSQGSSICSNDFHDFDSMFSHIAQSPLCAIINDSLMTPSPAPPMTPEEPPARGAAVLKYLIEKGFIEGEQKNLVTAEGIENAICALSKQKPITEITFEDVVSVIAGAKTA